MRLTPVRVVWLAVAVVLLILAVTAWASVRIADKRGRQRALANRELALTGCRLQRAYSTEINRRVVIQGRSFTIDAEFMAAAARAAARTERKTAQQFREHAAEKLRLDKQLRKVPVPTCRLEAERVRQLQD